MEKISVVLDVLLQYTYDAIRVTQYLIIMTITYSASLPLSLSLSPSLSTVTPFQCRLRDCTYSAPLYVNVRYTRQRQIVTKNGIQIGRIPIMLQSEHCILTGIIKIVKN